MRTEIGLTTRDAAYLDLIGTRGAWLSPLFSNEFSDDMHNPDDMSSVMMGDNIKVDFVFSPNVT